MLFADSCPRGQPNVAEQHHSHSSENANWKLKTPTPSHFRSWGHTLNRLLNFHVTIPVGLLYINLLLCADWFRALHVSSDHLYSDRFVFLRFYLYFQYFISFCPPSMDCRFLVRYYFLLFVNNLYICFVNAISLCVYIAGDVHNDIWSEVIINSIHLSVTTMLIINKIK